MPVDPDILSIFLVEAEGYLRVLRDPTAGGQAQRDAAHGLKGAAATLGLDEVARCARRLERAPCAELAAPPAEEIATIARLLNELRLAGGEGSRAAEAEAAPFEEDWDAETAKMLRSLFGEEARDHLEVMSEVLARPGTLGGSDLQELLRRAHTLKGSASTVGLRRLGEAAHRLEEVLVEVRDGRVEVDQGLLGRLLDATDVLWSMVDDLDVSDGGAGLLERFTRALRDTAPAAERGGLLSRREVMAAPAEGAEPGTEQRQSDRRIGMDRREAESRVRVGLDQLDRMTDLVGELVIARTRVERRVEDLRSLSRDLSLSRQAFRGALAELDLRGDTAAGPRLGEVEVEVADGVSSLERATGALIEDSEALRRTTHDLQEVLSRVRMMPVRWLHARLQRPLRGMAREEGKRVQLVVDDESSDVDRSVAEQLSDSLLQLLRNAVAHGIEPPAERTAAGKPEVGRIRITARHEGDSVVVEVEDDGRGIDPRRLRDTLRSKAWLDPATVDRLTDEEALEHIFAPGFSTRLQADELAGRGVGLDIVRRTIVGLGGDIGVRSEPGRGARFTIRMPTTTAIAQALLFKVGDQVYAIPVAHVVETVYVEGAEVRQDRGRLEVLTRDRWLPLLDLEHLLGAGGVPPLGQGEAASRAQRPVLILESRTVRFGARCTRVIGPREIVLKRLGDLLGGLPLFAGATISGSSKVQFVLDAEFLSGLALLGVAALPAPWAEPTGPSPSQRCDRRRILLADDSRTVREAVGHILRAEGYAVEVAADGWEAWERLQLETYDLLLTDLEMPRLRGQDLIVRCRESSGLATLPIVVLTSRTAERNRGAALAQGANAFVCKPINRKLVLQALRSLLPSL
jgi:chemotaxis protein histidine kinase CheA